jgi:hypothetical protein
MSGVDADSALAFQLDSPAGGGRDAGLVDIRNTARRAQVATQAIAVRQLVEELLANDNNEREMPPTLQHTTQADRHSPERLARFGIEFETRSHPSVLHTRCCAFDLVFFGQRERERERERERGREREREREREVSRCMSHAAARLSGATPDLADEHVVRMSRWHI